MTAALEAFGWCLVISFLDCRLLLTLNVFVIGNQWCKEIELNLYFFYLNFWIKSFDTIALSFENPGLKGLCFTLYSFQVNWVWINGLVLARLINSNLQWAHHLFLIESRFFQWKKIIQLCLPSYFFASLLSSGNKKSFIELHKNMHPRCFIDRLGFIFIWII